MCACVCTLAFGPASACRLHAGGGGYPCLLEAGYFLVLWLASASRGKRRQEQTSRHDLQVGRRTVIRRLAEKGYTPKAKRVKNEQGEKWRKTRVAFVSKHKDKTASQWCSFLQGVGDLKDFTWYPKELRPRFLRPWGL